MSTSAETGGCSVCQVADAEGERTVLSPAV